MRLIVQHRHILYKAKNIALSVVLCFTFIADAAAVERFTTGLSMVRLSNSAFANNVNSNAGVILRPTKTATLSTNTRFGSSKKQSVLANGTWAKVNVEQCGIYRIAYSDLRSWGFDNLEHVSVWGYGGGELPIAPEAKCPDDLVPIPIYIERGADGIFNDGDYILFYADGPNVPEYKADVDMWTIKQHSYSNTASYFITTSQPQRLMATAPAATTAANRSTSSYTALAVFAPRDTNLLKSGRQWFGDLFDFNTHHTYNTGLNAPESGSNMRVWLQAAGVSNYITNFSVDMNGAEIGQLAMAALPTTDYADVASINSKVFTVAAPSNEAVIGLTFHKAAQTDVGWLNCLVINSRQQLRYADKQLIFWDNQTAGAGNITRFDIQNAPNSLMVWDISHANHTQRVNMQGSSFTLNTDTLRRFVAFTASNATPITSASSVPNQNLHGMGQPNMVIVASPQFMEQAEQVAALHRSHDGLSVTVLSTEQVYNEFASGNTDAAAIRNLMRMLHLRATSNSERPRYLLLFGDGSYNNIARYATNTNLIPTFQSENSISPVNSYQSDDFFGLLDDGEANEHELNGMLDIGVGRIPAHSTEQANIAVAKLTTYMSSENIDNWQRILCFVGDDEDNNMHMTDANTLADHIMQNYPAYHVQKILLDAYQQEVTSLGQSYPMATQAINSRMNSGALLLNYTGHANERWLSSEKVLMINDILTWQNFKGLPLFITATCEFSRFDDYHMTTAGEHALFSPSGGAIALLSTTRVVYSNPNFELNYNFIKRVLETNASGEYYSLGDLVRQSKNATTGNNKLNFSLLGDPALKLRHPSHKVVLRQVNGTDITTTTDTLRALSQVHLNGHVCTNDSVTLTDFNGTVHITLYDKAQTNYTLANDGGDPMPFVSQENMLFSGSASVRNGEFDITFTMPKDINFSHGPGKISMLAGNNQVAAMGACTNVVVGGINPTPWADTRGPEITLLLNGKDFSRGGICHPSPTLEVLLTDESGINTSGIGIGHDFVATLTSSNGTNTFNLNNYYQSELDNPLKGKAIYRFTNLSEGTKNLRVKVWDIYNNSSTAQISFTVVNGDGLIAQNLVSCPNPLHNYTDFYFEHNQSQTEFEIDLQIYSITGTLVRRIQLPRSNMGDFRFGPIRWDGCGNHGQKVASGVYIARMTITTPDRQRITLQQKLIVVRQ